MMDGIQHTKMLEDADTYKFPEGEIDAPSNRQVGGSHYKAMAIQPTDFIIRNDIGWCAGNAIKYICRHSVKGGANDIDKAIHYLQLLKEKEYE